MNIGIVTTWFERGAAYVSKAYLEALSPKHNVFIYARGGVKYAIDDPEWDYPFVTWGKKTKLPLVTFIDWKDFVKWITLNSIDAVIFNEQRDWDIILKCQKLEILIGSYIDYYTNTTVDFFGLYDFLLCNTKRHYSVFCDYPQAVYIPWGTDCRVFTPRKGSIDHNVIRFFHSAGLGGINFRKGTDILVNAFQKVSGNVKLIIHSQREMEIFGSIASLIKKDPRITFINETVGPPGLYHLGDVYVYPTRLEGIGLTIPEALACGLPVTTTDSPPMNEFVTNNLNGNLVEVESFRERADDYYWPENICSETALTESMQYYVDNPDILKEQKQCARQYAVDNLDWRKNSSDLANYMFDFKQLDKPRKLLQKVKKYSYKEKLEAYISITKGKLTQQILTGKFL